MTCPSPAPTYTNDTQVLFTGHCVKCHAPGGVEAARPLNSYDAVRAQTGALDQVYACKMPPPPEPALSAAERATLLAWFVCGSPQN
jgi:mono/diheme cytochrome c family protein